MKNPKITLMLLATALASFSLTSCMDCIQGTGEVKSHSFPLEPFTEIKLDSDADVYLVSDTIKEIVVEAQDNIAANLEMKVRNGSLRIGNRKCVQTQEPVKIFIPVKLIENIQLNGSGNLESKFPVSSKTLTLEINGSGDMKLNISAETIFSQINGAGNIYLDGSSKRHKTLINGSGNIEAENMPTEKTEITINGSGSCKVFAISNLSVLVRGSGDVFYKGSPDVSTKIKGSGSVGKLEN